MKNAARLRLRTETVPARHVGGERVGAALQKGDQPRCGRASLADRDDASPRSTSSRWRSIASPILMPVHQRSPKRSRRSARGALGGAGGLPPSGPTLRFLATGRASGAGSAEQRRGGAGPRSPGRSPASNGRSRARWKAGVPTGLAGRPVGAGEGHGQLGGDARSAGGIEVVDEVRQNLPWRVSLKPSDRRSLR